MKWQSQRTTKIGSDLAIAIVGAVIWHETKLCIILLYYYAGANWLKKGKLLEKITWIIDSSQEWSGVPNQTLLQYV